MRINQNIAAFNSYRNLSATNTVMGKSLEKLSSGFRINRAADDAAGLVISQGLRAQVAGLRQATRNAQDGISVVQTAEGALNEVHAMLERMRTLAVQASNSGSNGTAARTAAQEEVAELSLELDRIAESTKFGDMALLDGTFGQGEGIVGADVSGGVDLTGAAADVRTFTLDFGGTVGEREVVLDAGNYADADAFKNELARAIQSSYATNGGEGSSPITVRLSDANEITLRGNEGFEISGTTAGALATALGGDATSVSVGTGGRFQVGANNGDNIDVAIDSVSVASLQLGGLDLVGDAENAIDTIQAAIDTVSTLRGELGAKQNRFESTINNLQVTTENLAASESRIRDTDMALEMVSFTRHQILLQAGTAMLGQANQLPQSVLRLLG